MSDAVFMAVVVLAVWALSKAHPRTAEQEFRVFQVKSIVSELIN